MTNLDRVETLYKTGLRIFGVLTLASSLWMIAHYEWGAGNPARVQVLTRSAAPSEAVVAAKARERRAGLILGTSGAVVGIALLVSAELIGRFARAARNR